MMVVDILMLFNAYLLRIKLTAHLFKLAKVLNTVFSCLRSFLRIAANVGQLHMTLAMFCSNTCTINIQHSCHATTAKDSSKRIIPQDILCDDIQQMLMTRFHNRIVSMGYSEQ